MINGFSLMLVLPVPLARKLPETLFIVGVILPLIRQVRIVVLIIFCTPIGPNAVAVALQPASLAPLLAILASRRLLIAPIIEGDPFRIRSRPIAMPFYSSFAVRVCIGLVVDFTLVDMLAIVATLASQHGFPVLFAIPLHASQSTFAIGLVAPLADLRVALTAKRSQQIGRA